MKTMATVDAVGRLVLPKSVREAMGVFGRARVILEVFGGRTQITLVEPPASPSTRKGGRLVFSGSVPEEWDSGEAVSRMRRQRLGK
jgi:bifunctional DNA-binding transcriptional regulator/antitoxin component of YhaV-PrlF toxin-antitoxin module